MLTWLVPPQVAAFWFFEGAGSPAVDGIHAFKCKCETYFASLLGPRLSRDGSWLPEEVDESVLANKARGFADLVLNDQ